MVLGMINDKSSTTMNTITPTSHKFNKTIATIQDVHHNNSILLNLREVMAMKPENLPTIDERYYTNLVTQNSNTEKFVMDIPQDLNDAYSIWDQYVKRLQNRGQLPPDFQARKVKRNEPTFDPSLFRLTAYDCNKPTNIKNLRNGPDNDCLDNDVERPEAENMFTVIRETKTRRHSGFRCVILETRRTYQCGGFDHSINVDHLTYENRAIRVSKDICERMAYQR